MPKFCIGKFEFELCPKVVRGELEKKAAYLV